jgi:hypothetical protein
VKAAALLIILLSNQGYWLSGRTASVSAQWNPTAANLPQAELRWELLVGNVPLTAGKIAMNAGAIPTKIEIQCPDVRVRTNVRWAYRLIQQGTDKELEKGETALQLFPATIGEPWPRLLKDKQLYVYDEPNGLPKLLESAKVEFTRVEDASRIDRADIILVGPDQLDDSTFSQTGLIALAERGASVIFFAQSKPAQLASYPVVERPMPTKLVWKLDHPLFDQLSEADLQSWLTAPSAQSVRAIRLPADEPALELAYWLRETPGKTPAPIDAVALTKTVGTGRIVLFQLPLGNWPDDPRSQILLGNALAYGLAPPQPTLRPSERETTKPSATQPTIAQP